MSLSGNSTCSMCNPKPARHCLASLTDTEAGLFHHRSVKTLLVFMTAYKQLLRSVGYDSVVTVNHHTSKDHRVKKTATIYSITSLECLLYTSATATLSSYRFSRYVHRMLQEALKQKKTLYTNVYTTGCNIKTINTYNIINISKTVI